MSEGRWEPDVAARMTAIGERHGARAGHMFGHPALYAGRRLAVCAYGTGLGFKLPADRVQQLIDTGAAVHFQPYGKAPMREWVHLPAATSEDVDDLTDVIADALDYAHAR